MADASVQWLVKDKDGVIRGPFPTKEVLDKIRSGRFFGEESISLYPSGQWVPISYEEAFFDALLDSLDDEMQVRDEDSISVAPSLDKSETEKPSSRRQWGDAIHKENQTAAASQKDSAKASAERLRCNAKKGKSISAEEERHAQGPQSSDRQNQQQREDAAHEREQAARAERVRNENLRRKRGQQRRLRLVIIAGLVGTIIYFFPSKKPQNPVAVGDRNHLVRPKWKKNRGSRVAKQNLKQAISHFHQDQARHYFKAQQLLVGLVEKTNDPLPFQYLCLTYKELWSSSFKDSQDFETVLKVVRRAQKLEPLGRAATLCKLVYHWINGEYDTALRAVEVKLAEEPSAPFLNAMAGDIYASRQDYPVAAFYFSKVRETWSQPPLWANILLQEARMSRLQKKHNEALRLYRQLLQLYPKHSVGHIEKGILEYEVFQNIEKAKSHLQRGMSEKYRIPSEIRTEAWYVMAKIYQMQGDSSEALKAAKKAFALDSSNQQARELVIGLGGIKALREIKIDNENLVDSGERFMKRGKYTAAQAQFRAAFEANPKNAFAALRAGQALWKLNQGKEAIAWVRRSVRAEPRLIRAYVVLSDYLSARYDFKNAIGALRKASRARRNHPLIWQGLARVEYRRRNYASAVKFADRALKLYETDIESLLIKARSKKELREYEDALTVVETAAQLDAGNDDIQTTYAKILAGQQGPNAGDAYLQVLIERAPNKLIFRRARGEILVGEQNFDEALEVYNDILEIDPDDKQTLILMGQCLQKMGEKLNYDSARNYFLDAAALDPSDAEPLFLLGKLFLESGQAQSAQAQFARVIQVNTLFPLAHYYMGKALLEGRDLDRALEMANEEKKRNPGLPEPHLLAGEIFYKKSVSQNSDPNLGSANASQCVDEFREAIKKGHRFATSYIWLARCLRLMGAMDPAESMLDEAALLESGNPEIYKEYGAIYEVKGSLDKAVERYNKYLRLKPEAKDSADIRRRVLKMQSLSEEDL